MSALEELTLLAAAQRDAEVVRLVTRAGELRQIASSNLLREIILVFGLGDPGFERAAATAARILLTDCDARRVERVTFRPNCYALPEDPGVTVAVFYRLNSGRCAAECNVRQSELLKAWGVSPLRERARASWDSWTDEDRAVEREAWWKGTGSKP